MATLISINNDLLERGVVQAEIESAMTRESRVRFFSDPDRVYGGSNDPDKGVWEVGVKVWYSWVRTENGSPIILSEKEIEGAAKASPNNRLLVGFEYEVERERIENGEAISDKVQVRLTEKVLAPQIHYKVEGRTVDTLSASYLTVDSEVDSEGELVDLSSNLRRWAIVHNRTTLVKAQWMTELAEKLNKSGLRVTRKSFVATSKDGKPVKADRWIPEFA